ncbi:MAG: cell division protein FtsZ, partial [Porphyromonadaceae bacterium]|nr:cell division protein FtsZ [Porphyromonadaceae bacterium]
SNRAIRINNYGTASQSARERSTLSAFDLHTPRPEPSQYTTSSTTFTTSTPSRPEPVEEATQPEEEKTEETPENVIRFSGF